MEINNTPQIAETLHNDLEYENLWKVHTGNKKPQQLSAGFARGTQLGVKMSPQVKRIGCSNLKMLIEGDKLLISDFDTYSELTTFVQDKNSFVIETTGENMGVMQLIGVATLILIKKIANKENYQNYLTIIDELYGDKIERTSKAYFLGWFVQNNNTITNYIDGIKQ